MKSCRSKSCRSKSCRSKSCSGGHWGREAQSRWFYWDYGEEQQTGQKNPLPGQMFSRKMFEFVCLLEEVVVYNVKFFFIVIRKVFQ